MRMKELLTILPLLQEGGSGQLLTMILPFGLIILVFYFLIIRPQNKKQKETQRMLSALKKNDRAVTAGGIRGTVVSVKEDTVVMKVDDNVKIEFSKSSITNILTGNSSKNRDSSSTAGDKKEDNSNE
jgi:preprotein translocase subunit YajC